MEVNLSRSVANALEHITSWQLARDLASMRFFGSDFYFVCEPVVITPSGNDVDYSTKDPRHGITKSTFKSLSLKIRPLQWPALRRLLTGRRCVNQNKHTQKGSKQISDHYIC